jgi:hypothetical protein
MYVLLVNAPLLRGVNARFGLSRAPRESKIRETASQLVYVVCVNEELQRYNK